MMLGLFGSPVNGRSGPTKSPRFLLSRRLDVGMIQNKWIVLVVVMGDVLRKGFVP